MLLLGAIMCGLSYSHAQSVYLWSRFTELFAAKEITTSFREFNRLDPKQRALIHDLNHLAIQLCGHPIFDPITGKMYAVDGMQQGLMNGGSSML